MKDSLSACQRKTGYSKVEAKREQALRRKGFKGSIYHCQHCGKWHLTRISKNYISPQIWESISKEGKKYV